ncbi:MAG: DUF5050 domain-containing protein [Oscillospiraceae bacterium]|nr:DUF5050 domain-containing protein [Oscillospiraceae bacterium]
MKKILTIFLAIVMAISVTTALSPTSSAAADWIYYSNKNDVDRPYRVRSDGTGLARLSMQSAVHMEVLGDWVYYCNPALTGGAFRTKTDGSVTEKLIDGMYNDCYGVYLDKGNIYLPYICHADFSDSGMIESNIDVYTSKGLAGTQCIDRRIAGYSGSISKFMGAYENRLYYKSADGNNYLTYTVNVNDLAPYPGASVTSTLPYQVSGEFSTINPGYSTTAYFARKYLSWKAVANAEKYCVYVKSSGKYKKVKETTDTYASFTVRNSALDAEYMVTAVKNGKNYKAKLITPDYKLGNNPANMSNGGIAAELSGTHYLCLSDGIYTVNPNNNSKKKISDLSAKFLNVCDGKLYFASGSDIYRMEPDGSGLWRMTSYRTVCGIYDSRRLEICALAASGNSLFLSLRDVSKSEYHTLIMNTNDSSAREIGGRKAESPAYAADMIVYRGVDGLIYSISDEIEYNITTSPANCVTTDGSKLYYGDNSGIYTMNPDGTNVKKIYNSGCDSIAVSGKKIYFVKSENTASGKEKSICKISLDGSGYRQLVKADAKNLNIIGETLYYTDSTGTVYKCGTSGSQAMAV